MIIWTLTAPMSEDTQRALRAAALRTIITARIACTNTIAELEVIDNLTDDWNLDNARLATGSLEIHLQAEFCAKEASTVLENLNTIMNTGRMVILEEWLCMELEIRRENAVLAATQIISVIESLETAYSKATLGTDDLGLVEIKRRVQLIVVKLENLKNTLVKLALDWEAAIQASINPSASDGDVFRYVAAELMADFQCVLICTPALAPLLAYEETTSVSSNSPPSKYQLALLI